MATVLDRFYGTGRRKTSVARVWIRPGSGRVTVNRREFADYFPRETLRMIIAQPFQVTSTEGQFDLICTVAGGGPTGQAGAVRRLERRPGPHERPHGHDRHTRPLGHQQHDAVGQHLAVGDRGGRSRRPGQQEQDEHARGAQAATTHGSV